MTISSSMKGLLAASIALILAGSAFAASPAPTATAKYNTSALQDSGTYDAFIVRYRDGSTERVSSTAAVQNVQAAASRAGKMRSTLSLQAPQVNYQRKLATGSDLLKTSRKLTRTEAEAFIQAIAADPAVEHVAPDVMRRAIGAAPAMGVSPMADFVPDDARFADLQTNFLPADGALTPVNKIANYGGANITGAWQLADGTGVTIAVLDTGIIKHADLDTSMGDAGYDFIFKTLVSGRATDGRVPGGWDTGDWTTGDEYLASNKGCVDFLNPARDSSWHGSHVAGTAGAELTNNGFGVAGVAYNAKVVPVRVLGHCGGYDSDINDAIVWAAGGEVPGIPTNLNPAQVINLSLGGPGACPATDDAAIAIAKANALGATVVIAAGNANGGRDVATSHPASCPGAVTVAAISYTSARASYSYYNAPGGNIIALGAPGGAGDGRNPEGYVWQAGNEGTTVPLVVTNDKEILSGFPGTSMAAPHVAGVVALMQSARLAADLPLLTPAKVLSILKSTAAKPKIAPEAAKGIGAGILDAGAAVAAAVADDGGDGGDGGDGDGAVELTNGVAVAGQSGAAAGEKLYKVEVPAGALALTLRTFGGTGDVSVFVKVDGEPTDSDYSYKSVRAGNSESVTVSRPVAGTYYVKVVGVKAYAGVSVQANFLDRK